MPLLFALLTDGPLIPPDYQGPAWVGLIAAALVTLQKLANAVTEYLSAKRIQHDEAKLKKEATQTTQPTVPFIPESMEARIFRLEKDKLETELKAEQEDNATLRAENAKLRERLIDTQDELLLEQRKSADLRIDLRQAQERREYERENRTTDPLRRPLKT